EAVAVAGAVDVVDDRRLDVAGAQEVGVQGMHVPVLFQGLLTGRQGLAQHLAAKDVLGADVAALATEQVVFQALQAQQFDQFGDEGGVHGGSGGEGRGLYPPGRPAQGRMRSSGTSCSRRDQGKPGPRSSLRRTRRSGPSLAGTSSRSRSSWPATNSRLGISCRSCRSRAVREAIWASV